MTTRLQDHKQAVKHVTRNLCKRLPIDYQSAVGMTEKIITFVLINQK